MGFWTRLFANAESVVPVVSEAHRPPAFAVDATSYPPSVVGLAAYSANVSAARVDRRLARQVPAVKRAEELVATTLGGLPLDLFAPDKAKVSWPLLEQPEKGRPRSVTMAELYADLFYDKHAWWQVTEYGWHGYPIWVKRRDPHTEVNVDEDATHCPSGHANCTGRVYILGKHVADEDIIHFESPNEPLLVAGARAIRTCLLLDEAANRYADGAPPMDYVTPAMEGVDPFEDSEAVADFLDAFAAARKARTTPYIPALVKYNVAGWNPEQLQLADARQHAVLEIARCAGVDPEDLGVSTTSRTYFNAYDRKQHRIQGTLRGYMLAVEERFSMGDVTPRGYVAKTNLSDFLRSDDLTRFQSYQLGLQVGAYADQNEVREAEGKAPLTSSQTPALPAPAPEDADA